MSDLILWRHADAEAGSPDLKRALTRKGHKQARRVAHWLHERLPRDAVICCSPAVRAQQTALQLARLAPRQFITVEALAPATRLDAALGAIRASDSARCLVVVGHQPTLGEIAARLLGTDESEWPIKKGALLWLTQKDVEHGPRIALLAAITPDLV